MNDIDEIRKRILKRRNRPVLTNKHFARLYNLMIKCMVVIFVGVAICAYIKQSPQGQHIRNYILNETRYNETMKWINQHVLTWGNQPQSTMVSQKKEYEHIKDNYYTNHSNEVVNFSKGRVIYVGKQEMLGQYITVLLENNIEVTFGNLNDIFVSLYDQVDKNTILGTYQDQVMIVFTQGEKEIDYSTFEEYL